MQHGYVLNVMSLDRPGIVAGVSAAISELDGNIKSCSQTVLNGYFTLIMTFSLPKKWKTDDLEATILQNEGLGDCQAMVRPMEADAPRLPDRSQNVFVITAFGKDRKSIVARFSAFFAEKDINIIDLYGDLTHEGEFVLISQIEVDPTHDIRNLQLDLEEMGLELGFTVKLQHNNIFVATNRIRLD